MHRILLFICIASLAAAEPAAERHPLYGQLRLVQSVDCSDPPKDVRLRCFPRSVGVVQEIAGAKCLTLAPTSKDATYITMRLGKGMGLKAGAAYVLVVEYPEDRPRSMMVLNNGNDVQRGFSTGTAMDDGLTDLYYSSNPESIDYPLTGRIGRWESLFWLHDRTPEMERPREPAERALLPEDGFTVSIAHTDSDMDPLSAGLAVSRVALYEVVDAQALSLAITYPPEGLPRRFSFWREEMADIAIPLGHKSGEKDPKYRGVTDITAWFEYKAKLAKFLGINTYCKDLLEFGHNQGWDAGPYGGEAWVYASSTPELWGNIIAMLGRYDLAVLPYYEYRGSFGNGAQAVAPRQLCRSAKGSKTYTGISWCEQGNADVVHPDTLADGCKVLDATIVRYKDQVKFVGAWLRARPTALPVSFSDFDLDRYSAERSIEPPVARTEVLADPKMLDDYYQWWFAKRRAFLEGLRDHLRQTVGKDQIVMFTAIAGENGSPLPGEAIGAQRKEPEPWRWKQVVVADDAKRLAEILASPRVKGAMGDMCRGLLADEVLQGGWYAKGLSAWSQDWNDFDVRHSTPPADPEHYRDSDGVLLTYPFNRLYTVADAAAMESYRTKAGLAMIRHHPLNENELTVGGTNPFGYTCIDVERNGPYCMAAEVRAMANGDPRYLGYLMGNGLARGYPEYVRGFNAAFLALPAVPSTVVKAGGDPEVVVREYKTASHGTWYALINTGLSAKAKVTLALPAAGRLSDAATGKPMAGDPRKLVVSFHPCQMLAVRVQ